MNSQIADDYACMKTKWLSKINLGSSLEEKTRVAKENCARAELIVLLSFSQACMIPDLHRADSSKYMTKIIRQPS